MTNFQICRKGKTDPLKTKKIYPKKSEFALRYSCWISLKPWSPLKESRVIFLSTVSVSHWLEVVTVIFETLGSARIRFLSLSVFCVIYWSWGTNVACLRDSDVGWVRFFVKPQKARVDQVFDRPESASFWKPKIFLICARKNSPHFGVEALKELFSWSVLLSGTSIGIRTQIFGSGGQCSIHWTMEAYCFLFSLNKKTSQV